MDWIKKHTDQFALGLLALILLALSVLVILKTQGFSEGFSDAMKSAMHSKDVPRVDTTVIEAAQKQLTNPVTWVPNEKSGSLFVSAKLVVDPTTQQLIRVTTEGMLHPPVPNVWLNKYELDVMSSNVLKEDPDGDGFSNLDEYQGDDRLPVAEAPIADEKEAANPKDATNPKDKNSHPAYHTKLFLKQWIKIPFLLLFQTVDLDAKNPKDPKLMTFAINSRGKKTEFLKLGDKVDKSPFRLEKYEEKKKLNPKTGDEEDVSELTVLNTETNDPVVLVLGRQTDSPDSFAYFVYLWPDASKPVDIRPKKLQKFALKPGTEPLYKLIDIDETKAVIQLPDGKETYTVPLLSK